MLAPHGELGGTWQSMLLTMAGASHYSCGCVTGRFLLFGEDGHMGCISCSVKLKGSVYFTLYLHIVAHLPGGLSASLLQH